MFHTSRKHHDDQLTTNSSLYNLNFEVSFIPNQDHYTGRHVLHEQLVSAAEENEVMKLENNFLQDPNWISILVKENCFSHASPIAPSHEPVCKNWIRKWQR